MIFVTGPLFAGKREYIRAALGWSEEELSRNAVWDVQELVREGEDPAVLAEELAGKPVVIASEVGGGVVPADPALRRQREAARRSQRVGNGVRVGNGIAEAF